jgi:hypothetical protein
MIHGNDNNDDGVLGVAEIEISALVDAFNVAMETIGFYEEEVADLLRLPIDRLPLRLNRPALSKWRETRVRHLLDIATALGLLLGDEDEMAGWLRRRSARLDWLTPADFMIDVEEGVVVVRRMLLQESYDRFGPIATRSML